MKCDNRSLAVEKIDLEQPGKTPLRAWEKPALIQLPLGKTESGSFPLPIEDLIENPFTS